MLLRKEQLPPFYARCYCVCDLSHGRREQPVLKLHGRMQLVNFCFCFVNQFGHCCLRLRLPHNNACCRYLGCAAHKLDPIEPSPDRSSPPFMRLHCGTGVNPDFRAMKISRDPAVNTRVPGKQRKSARSRPNDKAPTPPPLMTEKSGAFGNAF